MTSLPDETLTRALRAVADHTAPACASCVRPHGCCSASACEETIRVARELFGLTIEPGPGDIPLLGERGCRLAPELRPICAVHVCERHLSDPAFAETYFLLREAADDALFAHFETLPDTTRSDT